MDSVSRKRALQFIVGTAGVAALWQLASLFFPDYLFPSIPQIVRRFVELPNGNRIPLPPRKAVTCTCADEQGVSIVPAETGVPMSVV